MIKKLLDLYKKYEEVISYLIFGGLTTVVSFITYFLFSRLFFTGGTQLDIQISNVLSWVCAVTFAYITNRIFVFKSKNKGQEQLKELISFIGARVFSLVVDIACMFLLTELIHMNDLIAKLIVQVIVIVMNYVLSKLFIFKKKD